MKPSDFYPDLLRRALLRSSPRVPHPLEAENARLKAALKHQRNALQIVRDRQHGNVSIADLNRGIALIDAALNPQSSEDSSRG